ncbi:hypothetical protein [Salinimonas chungwhensis]|uniref:hypothetical protein n=1 Tax=Salinimonas chungwhensis TaxID=265425 RepID=UPI0003747E50|nr:hypothetical protein [Salinimonas chungwhensis]
MKKLTSNQTELLHYFANGGYVELCTSVCNQFGKTNFPKVYPLSFSKTVLYSLIKEGLLRQSTEQCVYGLRWSRVEISERGIKHAQALEASNETV